MPNEKQKVQPESQNNAPLKGKEKHNPQDTNPMHPSTKRQRCTFTQQPCVGRRLALCQILAKQRHPGMFLQDWNDFRLEIG